MPSPIQYMVNGKQNKYPGSRPFVSRIAPELLAHQEQQSRRHSCVNCPFQFSAHRLSYFKQPQETSSTASGHSSETSVPVCLIPDNNHARLRKSESAR